MLSSGCLHEPADITNGVGDVRAREGEVHGCRRSCACGAQAVVVAVVVTHGEKEVGRGGDGARGAGGAGGATT